MLSFQDKVCNDMTYEKYIYNTDTFESIEKYILNCSQSLPDIEDNLIIIFMFDLETERHKLLQHFDNCWFNSDKVSKELLFEYTQMKKIPYYIRYIAAHSNYRQFEVHFKLCKKN